MRLFVGVELDEPVRRRAAALAAELRDRVERRHQLHARWIEAANLHLTLCFIGEVDDARAESMRGALEQPFNQAPFPVRLHGFGAFPPSGAPRVLWLGAAAGLEPLARLHQDVESRLIPLGYEPERRPYSAHLTLARVKDVPRGPHGAIRALLADLPADAGTFTATGVTLFRSRLSPHGAKYEPLLRVPLG